MGRRIDVDHLVDAAEIARRLRVAQAQVVHVWRRRYADFPTPVAVFGKATIFYWPDVERWARRSGRWPPSGDVGAPA